MRLRISALLLLPALLLAAACGDDDGSDAPDTSDIYFEATITTTEADGEPGQPISNIRVWFQDATTYRVETDNLIRPAQTAFVRQDDDLVTFASPGDAPVPVDVDREGFGPPALSIVPAALLIGPSTYPDLERFLAALDDLPVSPPAVGGEKTILG